MANLYSMAGGGSSSGGTVTGTGTANQIAYWDGASSITGSANFVRDAADNIALGTATDAGSRFLVSLGTGLTGTTQNGIYNFVQFNSACTTQGYGILSQPRVADASFTMARLAAVMADIPTLAGTANAVTRFANIVVQDASAVTRVSNSACITDTLAYTAGNWFIRQDGTISSRFGGPVVLSNLVGIAGTTSTGKILSIGNGGAQTLLSGTSQAACEFDSEANASATAYAGGLVFRARTKDAIFVTGFAYGLYENSFTKGAQNTSTRYCGIRLTPSTAGTNNCSISDNETFTGNTFINQTGTVASNFGGTVNVANLVTTTGVSMAADGVGNIGVGAADAVGTDRALGIGAKRIFRLGGSAYWLDTGTAQTTMVLNTTGWRFTTDTGNIYFADGSGNLVQFLMTDGSILTLGTGSQVRTPYSTAAKPGFSSNSNNTSGLAITAANAMNLSTNGTARLLFDSTGNTVVGTAAIATSATDGFLYIPGCAGAATGTVTTYTGRCATVGDITNFKLYVNFAGTWKSIQLV